MRALIHDWRTSEGSGDIGGSPSKMITAFSVLRRPISSSMTERIASALLGVIPKLSSAAASSQSPRHTRFRSQGLLEEDRFQASSLALASSSPVTANCAPDSMWLSPRSGFRQQTTDCGPRAMRACLSNFPGPCRPRAPDWPPAKVQCC